jgi:hypothetical protein
LDGGSARRKPATYTQDSTNTEQKHTDIHALSGIRTHNPSFRTSEVSSCLRLRGHCDRQLYQYTLIKMIVHLSVPGFVRCESKFMIST